MPQTFKLPFLRNHKKYKGVDQRYIGLALDVLLVYLNWKPGSYEGHDFGKLSDMTRMSMFERPYQEGEGRRITVTKIKEREGLFGYTEYEIEGFPDEEIFAHFKRNIPRIYRDILHNRC